MSTETDTPRMDAVFREAQDFQPSEFVVPLSEGRIVEQELNEALAEIVDMRDIFPQVLQACGSALECSPDASLQFLSSVPDEVRAVIRGIMQQRDRLAHVLRNCLDYLDGCSPDSPWTRLTKIQQACRGVLAEVEGKEGA